MKNCKNCNALLQDEDKFCGECGTPVDSTSYEEAPHHDSKPKQEMGKVFEEILLYSKHMITKPITTISNEVQLINKNTCFYLLGLLSILNGIISIMYIKTLVNSLDKLFSLVQSVLSYRLNIFNEFFHIDGLPYGKIFFFFVIFFLVGAAGIFISSHLIINYIFKNKVQIEDSIKITTLSLIPMVVGKLLAFILTNITPLLGYLVIFFSFILCILIFFKGIVASLNQEEDKVAFMVPICYLISFFCEYTIIKMFVKNLFH